MIAAHARAAASAETSEGVTVSGVHWRMGDWTLSPEAGEDTPGSGSRSGSASAESERRAALLQRRRFVGRAWARELVTAGLDMAWPGFATDVPRRKPRLRGDLAIDLSIAHSGSTLLVAVVADGLVGADVEEEPFDVFDRAALVRRMCAPGERSRLDGLPRAERRRALARAWTIKEATLKARGTGLGDDPRSVPTDAFERSAGDTASGPERAIVHLTTWGGCLVSFPGRDDGVL